LPHLQAIHRHLFSSLYDWAGEVRTVELDKGGHQFMFRRHIESGMADIHRRIVAADCFKGATRAGFAEEAGRIMGDVNYVHPFREGNGRTQLLYLQQLSLKAGHPLDLRHVRPAAWIDASKRAHGADYAPMSRVIHAALERSTGRPPPSPETTTRDPFREQIAKAEREASQHDDSSPNERDRPRSRDR